MERDSLLLQMAELTQIPIEDLRLELGSLAKLLGLNLEKLSIAELRNLVSWYAHYTFYGEGSQGNKKVVIH